MKKSLSFFIVFCVLFHANSQTITDFTPPTGHQRQFLTATITGQNTNFQQGTDAVRLTRGSTVITPHQTNVVSPTQINAVFILNQDHPVGYYNVSIQKWGSYTLSLNDCFYLENDTLISTIANISPSAAEQGESVTMIITGSNTNFGYPNTQTNVRLKQGANTIYPTGITIVNQTTIHAEFIFSYAQLVGNYDVIIFNSLDGTLTVIGGFTLNQGPSVPSITEVSPKVGVRGETLQLTITGQNTNFQQGTDKIRLSKSGQSDLWPQSTAVSNSTTYRATFNFTQSLQTGHYTINMEGNALITYQNGFTLAKLYTKTEAEQYLDTTVVNDTTIIIISPDIFSYATYLNTYNMYEAVLGDGNPLPGYMIFDPMNLILYIVNAKTSLDSTIVFTVTDINSRTASVAIPFGEYLTGEKPHMLIETKYLLFPNPSRSSLYISNLYENSEYIIYNILSNKIEEGRYIPGLGIPVSHLPDGIYFIEFSQEGILFRRKFFKL